MTIRTNAATNAITRACRFRKDFISDPECLDGIGTKAGYEYRNMVNKRCSALTSVTSCCRDNRLDGSAQAPLQRKQRGDLATGLQAT
jgi:hypothetical protein